MGIRFYFGPSDGGLSRKVYQDIIQHSMDHSEKNYYIVVPDQFTMQTQKEMATMHPRGGILNIDVLSFGRLSHRVLEEVGCKEIPVLDDTGKCLVLQKVTEKMGDSLPVLGGYLHKQGYIHEVKSAISEFMQYGLSTSDLEELIAFSAEKKVLSGKLRDLSAIYESFEDYIRDHFVTAEETLDILCRNLSKSKLLPGSVVVLDGFTGFTPIQYRLVREMACLCDDMIITMVCGEEESPYHLAGEQKLFYLTQKTVTDLERIAAESKIERDRSKDVFLTDGACSGDAFWRKGALVWQDEATAAWKRDKSELAFLREHLFRYDGKRYRNVQASNRTEEKNADLLAQISLREMTNPAQEVHQTAIEIQRLLREQRIAFRDIVIVTGDLEGYAPYVESEFSQMGIPYFVDRTRGITLNPFTEFMLSALELSLKNYSYEAVFHYLRSGMTGIPIQEIDRLENYVLAAGIRGKKAYQNLFVKRTKSMDPKDETELQALNATRLAFMDEVSLLMGKKSDTACNYVERLYDFLVHSQCQRKLAEKARWFEEQGDACKAKEYDQIYRLVMDLLNQIHELLGEEKITLQEFADILSAGLGEIQVGTIPQNVDRVLVGDVERTRLKPVKVLFFLGVNDGIIPKSMAKGGIISDMEREFLKDSTHELAPTPRQHMFIQRFYLYLTFSKPQERLYLSFVRQGSDGKALRPAYLVDVIKKMFPTLSVFVPQAEPGMQGIMTLGQGREILADEMRDYASGILDQTKEKEFLTLYEIFEKEERKPARENYENAAFSRYEESALSREISKLIYGTTLENSVSRLETFASCAYRHFLQYGLALREREEFGFEAADLGNVYHHVLEAFSHKLETAGESWFTFDEAFAANAIAEIMEKEAAQYGGSVLFDTKRSTYQVKRMERVLLRTVDTLQKQLKKGTFVPKDYEVLFYQMQDISDMQVALTDAEKMRLKGRIDRIDTDEDAEHVYVKVMDYKSGDKKFDLVALYYGLQLQLVVYMNAAVEREKQRSKDSGKEVVPAALLYYHLEDPLVESDVELSEEELNAKILASLRAKGIVNDSPEVVKRLDKEFVDKSDVIPVERKKDGSYGAHASVMSTENLQKVSSFVSRKLTEFGRNILSGSISLNPYERGKENACAYCPYGKVCGFDRLMPGCKMRMLEELSDDEIMERMKEEDD